MVNLFRQIRQTLLTENKFSKYLFYAIGEILLVVIGILIALQVNEYQEDKKARSKECEYLASLITDLTIEKNFLGTYAEFDKEVISNAEALLQARYDQGNFRVDDTFSKQLSILNNRSTFRKHNTTYRELLATGDLNLLMDQALKQEILLYFQKVDQYETIIRQNNEYIDNHFAPLALRVGTHYVPNHQLKWSKNIMDKGYIREEFIRPADAESLFYKYISEKLEDPLEQLELLNQIQYRYRISVVHLSLVDELLDYNRALLDRILKVTENCP
ncbi:MAG: DUF6090 family protein [Eudoraea sp.]|nr:DUF6090 family protein [Eudoraea sp.]